jgi:hypothetical protein
MTITINVSHITSHSARHVMMDDGPTTAGFLYSPETTQYLQEAFPCMSENVHIRVVPDVPTLGELSECNGELLVEETSGTVEPTFEEIVSSPKPFWLKIIMKQFS